MVSVQTIVRRTPYGWETLLVVNGVVGRAEEMLCLEERPLHPFLTKPQLQAIFLAWLQNLPGPNSRVDYLSLEHWGMKSIPVTDPTARSASFVES